MGHQINNGWIDKIIIFKNLIKYHSLNPTTYFLLVEDGSLSISRKRLIGQYLVSDQSTGNEFLIGITINCIEISPTLYRRGYHTCYPT